METGELAARGAVSPELVLVDPELAAEARARLPDHPWPPLPRIEIDRAASAPARRRPPFGLAVGLAALFLLAGLSSLPPRDRPTLAARAAEVTARPQQQPPPVTRPRAQKPRREAMTVRIEPRARPKPRPAPVVTQQVEPRTEPAPRRPLRRPEPPQRPPSSRPAAVRLTPAPSFAWPPVAGARSYHALFFRDGKEIYEAETRVPRVRIPVRIRFTPGQYRWIVRPVIGTGPGSRLGAPIVDSTFRIDAD